MRTSSRSRQCWMRRHCAADTHPSDERYMRLALQQAAMAAERGEVPIGAVLVDGQGEVLSVGRNGVEAAHDATAHAELQCIREASQILGTWRLLNCTLYTTLEPCPMCVGAMQLARIHTLVYGASDNRMGGAGSWVSLATEPKHPFHQMAVRGGVMATEARQLLRTFFREARARRGASGVPSLTGEGRGGSGVAE
ncbi:unnamed protein product [Vitrella brassicaformis CCMP3155]|uniref:tRNA(adenine(34)) deaminase n=1 Tax=Vitrella brassicaformis (strain CCMP3155) TaxID=1169540 RepID=A0A0G4GWR4_VITBC|nr:unnamed protein product [Vitrella brassicaformis CCMP3155]|eukprot:CEM35424.1 unnamed protein product [Vitrella brassicaformis CCMP3155]